MPATKLAVAELSPLFVSFGRVALAGLAAAPALLLMRAPLPSRRQWLDLAIVAAGVVFGFPVLMSIAMLHADAGHGGVVLAVMPLLTAVIGAVVGGERPPRAFWVVAASGCATVLAYILLTGGGRLGPGDLLLGVAALCAAVGYVYGGLLSRALPSLAVIAWALVLSAPLAFAVVIVVWPADLRAASAEAWVAFFYVALGSQFLAFFFWYRGLAVGGISAVSQVQLLQTFLTLGFSALILGERIAPPALIFAAVTVVLVWLGQRLRTRDA